MYNNSKVAKAIRLAMMVGASAAATISVPAFAAEEGSKVEEQVERITVTGSRIKRTELESANPVTVITFDDMLKTGAITVADALGGLATNTGTSQPASFGGFTPNAQTVNLRGLGPQYTVTLINGRRIASYPAAYNATSTVTNFGAIPAAAVDRIEILASGASAIYGSDAVAGVVNIILKKNVDYTDIAVDYAKRTEGDGDTKRFQLVSGKTFDKGNITAALEYFQQEGVQGRDIEWLDSPEDFPNGDPVYDRGMLEMNQWKAYGFIEGERYNDPGMEKCNNTGLAGFDQVGRKYRPDAGYFCGYNDMANRTHRNDREKVNLVLSGNYELTNDITFFSDFMMQHATAENTGSSKFVSWNEIDGTVDVPKYGELVNFNLKQRYLTPEEIGNNGNSKSFTEDSFSIVAGFEGTIADVVEWEVVAGYSNYKAQERSSQMKEEKVEEVLFGAPGPNNGNSYFGTRWYEGAGFDIYKPLAAEKAAEVFAVNVNDNETSNTFLSLQASAPLYELPAGDIYGAIVVEYGKDEFRLTPDKRMLNQDGQGWYNLTGLESDGERTRHSVGVEVNIPVFEELEVSLAGRYDKYDEDTSNAGGAFMPQVQITYRPVDSIMLRATAAKTFRAPDMNTIFTTAGSYGTARDYVSCWDTQAKAFGSGFSDSEFDDSKCNAKSVFGLRQGTTELKDEEGTTYNLGLVWDITDDFNVTVDYWKVELEQVIVNSSRNLTLWDELACDNSRRGQFLSGSDKPTQGACDLAEQRITRIGTGFGSHVDSVNLSSVNQSAMSIDGIDISLDYQLETDFGKFTLDMNYTHTLGETAQDTSTSPEEEVRDVAGNWSARSRVNTSLGYQPNDDIRVTLTQFRRGSAPYRYQNQIEWDNSDGKKPVFRSQPFITYNLVASYLVTPEITVSARVVNLLDRKPIKDPTYRFYQSPWYNGFIYGGATGREVGLEARYRF